MDEPKEYRGPLAYGVPDGYVDVTSLSDVDRIGFASPNHPYWVLRGRILGAVEEHRPNALDNQKLVDRIMKAI